MRKISSDLGSFLMIYDFLCESLNFQHENLRFSLWKILIIFCMIFLTMRKISYYKVRVCTGSVETHKVRVSTGSVETNGL